MSDPFPTDPALPAPEPQARRTTAMRRLLDPFMLVLTAIVGLGYAYTALRLTGNTDARLALIVPFALVWVVPAVYWNGGRASKSPLDDWVHAASYLSMGWISFLVVCLLGRDALLAATALIGAPQLHALVAAWGSPAALGVSIAAFGAGAVLARRGPRLRQVSVPLPGLPAALDGLRIVQISDLHVGPTIGRRYVERVVALANAQDADLIALTGDIVDGTPARLNSQVAPLAGLRSRLGSFLVLGNHDCYSGAQAWTAQFRRLGMQVLLNQAVRLERGGARFVVGGVLDPAIRGTDPALRPQPELAADPEAGALPRILLAHHPALAPQAERAGFDLQLSGHTHAGQFFPWTLAVRLVQGPLAAGLSRVGRMWVYVSAGTGTWGPPVRFGTTPELTVVILKRAAPEAPRSGA